MEEFKSIYTSRTFWGVAVSIVGKLLAASFNVTIGEQEEAQIVSLLMLFISGGGDMLALYGRIKATKTIKR